MVKTIQLGSEGWLLDYVVSDFGYEGIWLNKTKEGTNNSERWWNLKVLNIKKKKGRKKLLSLFHDNVSLMRQRGKKQKI